MLRNFSFLVLIIVLNSCKTHYFLPAKGESKKTLYTYYCHDSLGIYSKFFGDFSQAQMSNPILSQVEKSILRKIGFQKNADFVLFHSQTNLAPYYNVIGILKKEANLSAFQKSSYNNSTYYHKTTFDLYTTYEILIPIHAHFFSIVFFEKNETKSNRLQNEIDYQQMTELTLDAIQQKECGKENILAVADAFFNEEKAGNYLAFKKIKQVAPNYIGTKDEGFYRQIVATYLSLAQENTEAEQEFAYYSGKQNLDFRSVPLTINALADSIKNHQFVFFNEAHHKPKHRYLVGSLLKSLYDAGFRYLGLEAFYEEQLLQKNTFPTLENGFYVRESTMANLIREAHQMGFTVFEYDSDGAQRELNQADVIYEKTLKKDPNAKVVLLAGYSHIDEKEGWMAEQLHTKYGINPFTINQTVFSTDVRSSKQPLEWVLDKSPNFRNDVFLYNNLSITNNCFDTRKSKQLTIPFETLQSENGILLVYNANEYEKVENPIPVFVKVLKKNQSNLTTNLCTGNYKVVVKNGYNGIVFESELEVE